MPGHGVPTVSEEAVIPGQIEQFTYTSWQGKHLIWVVEANRFEVSKRGYLAFQVHSLYEAVLHNAHFKVYQQKKHQSLPFFEAMERLSPLSNHSHKGDGHSLVRRYVTQGRIRPFALTVYENGQPLTSVKAQSGVVKGRGNPVKFSGVIIKNLNDQRIIVSNMALWDDIHNKFVIPGNYLAITPKGQAQGHGIAVGLDFSLAALP